RTATQPLLRHEGQPETASRGRVESSHRNAIEDDRLGVRHRTLARQGAEQLALAVAGYARDADDLAAAHREVDVDQVRAKWIVRRQRQRTYRERAVAARARLPVPRMGQFAADHHAGK